MLTALPSHSKTTLTKDRVTTLITEKGDTLIQMSYEDARTILSDLLQCKVTDSTLAVYVLRDSLNQDLISIKKETITNLNTKCVNYELKVKNFNELLAIKEGEISIKDDVIKQQKKEILKQKVYKYLGFGSAIILPILIVIYGQ